MTYNTDSLTVHTVLREGEGKVLQSNICGPGLNLVRPPPQHIPGLVCGQGSLHGGQSLAAEMGYQPGALLGCHLEVASNVDVPEHLGGKGRGGGRKGGRKGEGRKGGRKGGGRKGEGGRGRGGRGGGRGRGEGGEGRGGKGREVKCQYILRTSRAP